MLKKYTGSCHCKAVQYEVKLDISQGIRKCNCTFCYKTKMQKVFADFDKFRLLTSEFELSDYRGPDSKWPPGKIHHYFCKTCGVRCFTKGYLQQAPFNGWFYCINISTLDGLTPEEIIHAPVIYEDGLHDQFEVPPHETRHL